MGGDAEQQAEVGGLAYLDAPSGEVAVAVGYAVVPVVADVAEQDAVFGADVFAGDELDGGEGGAFGALDDVAELYEGVSPVAGVEGEVEVVVEPFAFEQGGGAGVGVALGVDEAVALLEERPLRWPMQPWRWRSTRQSV